LQEVTLSVLLALAFPDRSGLAATMINAVSGQGSNMLQMWLDKIKSADTDQSGSLSVDEFKTLSGSKKSDGAASAGRATPDASEMFVKLDADGNGQLTTEEMKRPPPRPPPPPSAGQFDNAAMSLLLGLQEDSADLTSQVSSKLIDATDTNGDGALSLEEYSAKATGDDPESQASRFANADGNQDGQLSAEELSGQLQDALTQRLQQIGRPPMIS